MVPFRAPWMVFALLLLVVKVSSETVEVAQNLVQFMESIDPGNSATRDPSFGWKVGSDPCEAKWVGVFCSETSSVKKVVLNGLNLNGILDARLVCSAKNLGVLSLMDNNVVGVLPEEISDCAHLTHLYLSGNNFTGSLPTGLAKLNNLKRVNISRNGFSGDLPDLSRISGLVTFRAEFNSLTGEIPNFDFSNLQDFNVSFNSFTGPVPDSGSQLDSSRLLGNPGLCGKPLSNPCPETTAPPPKEGEKHEHSSTKKYLIYSGYAILALFILLLLLFKVVWMKRKRAKRSLENGNVEKPSSSSSEFKGGELSRSEFSMTSPENNGKTSSLVVLSSPVVNGLKFEDLLRAPAELVGRGKHGTLYKVTLSPAPSTVAVKRIKDWEISRDEFKLKMQRINEVKHPYVLPVLAFYCSQQEKLLVYQFQHNGNLCGYLNGSQQGGTFDWGSRLNVAVRTANALAFMHKELKKDGIPHGNLKSSNILLNDDMEPCISEYGLMFTDHEDQDLQKQLNNESIIDNDRNLFKSDVYSFGLILLELLTGKLVNNRASELAGWVRAVVTEEWTAEVFDRALVSEGASEERMVNLLQVALKCINPSQGARPDSSQVASAINSIKEDEERSVSTSIEL